MSCAEQSTTEFRELKEFPGYRFGDDGSIWSKWARSSIKAWIGDSWHVLKQQNHRNGYLMVMLKSSIDGKKMMRLSHRLILEAFVGPCPEGQECRHFPDGNRKNNTLSNLSWGTSQDNADDRIKHETVLSGEDCSWAKMDYRTVELIRKEYSLGLTTQKNLALKYGVCQMSISLLVRGKTWKHLLPSAANISISPDLCANRLHRPRI